MTPPHNQQTGDVIPWPVDYDRRPQFVRPIPAEMLARAMADDQMIEATKAPSWFALLAADWADIISEVRASPYSHLLVALGAITFWTVILVAPLLIGAAS